jgi:hypothetical protein
MTLTKDQRYMACFMALTATVAAVMCKGKDEASEVAFRALR